MSIIIFLNGDRGLSVLKKIITCNYNIDCIVIPEKIKIQTKLLNFCRKNKLNLHVSPNPNQDNYILDKKYDLNIIAGYSTIFNKVLINKPRLGTINLHAGKLPKYRGGSPLNWQLINDESHVWCSIIRVTEKIDSGDILLEKSFKVRDEYDINTLHKLANKLFSEMIVKVINIVLSGKKIGTKQDESQASYFHQRSDLDGKINWGNMYAREVFNFVRALTIPYKGAFTLYNDKIIRIWNVDFKIEKIKGMPGRIIWLQGIGPFVICKDYAVKLTKYSSFDDIKLLHGTYFQ